MSKNQRNSGFSHVDGSANPQSFIDCLDEQYAINGNLQLNKVNTLQMSDIQPGHFVLDAGCGTGGDALQMASLVGHSGHLFGLDFSLEMIRVANARRRSDALPLSFLHGSICDLPFKDNFFDRCRADKTFQHLAFPKAALKELIRVTKSGGKLIIADPDHDSLIIDTPFAEINHRFTRFRSDHMAQGGIAHQLYGLFKAFGLVDVCAVPLTRVYTDYEEIWLAHEQGIVTTAEVEEWVAYLRGAIENDRFLCLQTYVVTTGIKSS